MTPLMTTTVPFLENIFSRSLTGWSLLLEQGGVISLVLMGLAIIGLAIILEKSYSLRRSVNFNDDVKDVLLALKRNNDDQIEYELHLYPQPQTELITTAHESRELDKSDLLQKLSEVANHRVRQLGKRLTLLGSLGRLAPLLGLLGTIIGLIQTLNEVSLRGPTDTVVLGQGLSEALLTTAGGLIVGIPILFFHSYFRKRINFYAERYEEFGHELVRSITYPASIEFGDDTAEDTGDSGSESTEDRTVSPGNESDGSGEDSGIP